MERKGFEQLAAEKGIDLDFELTKGFAARYIRRKAKQLVGKARFTPSDRPELEQDLMIRLLRCLPKFDPAKRHWQVFVKTVVERSVATILEARRAKKQEHRHNIASLSLQVPGEDGELVDLAKLIRPEHQEALTGQFRRADHDQVDLTHDVAVVLSRLPKDLRELCERLKTESLSQIARDWGVPRSTLYSKLLQLREVFAMAGLKNSRILFVNRLRNPVGKQ